MSARAFAGVQPTPPESLSRRIVESLTAVLMVVGAFCCPMTWSLAKGLLSVGDACFVLALVIQGPWMLQNLARLGGVPWLIAASGALFGLSGMTAFALGEQYAEPVNAAKLAFSMTVFPLLLVVTTGNRPALLDAVLTGWVAGATLSALVAIASRHQISLLGLFDSFAAEGNRARGLTYHSNILGYTSALAALAALYLGSRFRGVAARAAAGAAFSVLLVALYYSGSRAAVFSLALGLLFAALPRARMDRLALYGVLALGVLSIAAFALLIGHEMDLRVTEDLRESAIGRVLGLSETARLANEERRLFIELVWDAFFEHPLFGSGYGWLRGAHVHVLSVLHSGGLLGLLALLIWMVGVATAALTVHRDRTSLAVQDRALWPLAIGGVTIWFVDGALQPVLPDRNGYILVGVLFVLNARLLARRWQAAVAQPARMQTTHEGVWRT